MTKPTVLSVSLHKSVTHVLMISVILNPQLPSKNIFLFSKKMGSQIYEMKSVNLLNQELKILYD